MIMKLSIIIPVYNIENYISKCLDSILNQDFIDYEIILINDGSTDNSLSICKEYVIMDQRIKLFSQENRGVSAARNNGISKSNGEWLCFIDGDDFIEENSLGKLLKHSYSNDCECIIGRSYTNDGNKAIKEKYRYNESLVGNTYDGISLVFEKSYFRGGIWGVLYKKSLLIDNNILFPVNIRNGEDTIFFSLIQIYAKKIFFCDVYFYNLYERIGSASRSWTFDRVVCMIDNIKFINKYINDNPQLSPKALNILQYNIYRVVSTIYNAFSKCFSVRNLFIINSNLKNEITSKIDVGNIKLSSKKIKLMNTSLMLFALSILIKNNIKE